MKPEAYIARCPGFVGADLPLNSPRGKVVIEPGQIEDAMIWLRKRFHVSESLELSTDCGLCVEIIRKERRKRGQGRLSVCKPVNFGVDKPVQFELGLVC